ncbi:MAG: hypothetical protein ACRDO8_11560 [Nocardioidaceae bacterium]
MQVTDRDIERIPSRNIHVPRAEFVAVWLAATRYPGKNLTDWYGGGVARTCRWMACGIDRPDNGLWRPTPAPVTRRAGQAFEERIQAEYIAADRLEMRSPRPAWLLSQPGWIEGIAATLRWAWARNGPAPLPVDVAVDG